MTTNAGLASLILEEMCYFYGVIGVGGEFLISWFDGRRNATLAGVASGA